MRICRGSISIVFGLLVPQPVAVAIATIVLAAVSTRTPMIVQSSASKIIQPAEQASLDIVRSPVIEPISAASRLASRRCPAEQLRAVLRSFAAIRRVSSRVGRFAAARRPASFSNINSRAPVCGRLISNQSDEIRSLATQT